MQALRRISYYGFLVLLVYMPFHIFLTQSLSLATGGLEVWKVGKDVVLLALTLFTICLVWLQKQGSKLFFILLGLTILYGLVHLALWAFNPEIYSESAILGVIYNNRLPCFLLLGMGVALLNRDKFVFSSVIKIILVVSTLVAALGVLQYVLPKDLLTHVGYGVERGTRAAFFIDDNPALPRVFSTLREPNALGGYLLVPIALLVGLVTRIKDSRRPLLFGMLLLQLLAELLTFSRSAWIAAAVAVLFVLWWSYRQRLHKLIRHYWPAMACMVVVIGAAAFMLRDSYFFQHYIIHSDPQEEVADLDSNDYHVLLVRQGLQGVAEQPFGHGPGTAGLASIRDPAGGQLTENYYVQVAYEVGVLGLAIFVALNVIVFWRLWRLNNWIAAALMAAFLGYVVMNMLLHTWSNETIAAQWWLLAGAAIVTLPRASKKLASAQERQPRTSEPAKTAQ